MRRAIVFSTVAFCFACLASIAAAQPAPIQPGPEHQLLKDMEGTWEAKAEGDSMSTGKAVYKMEVGGLWQINTFQGSLEGFEFSGHGINGYDPVKKKYVSVWVDSISPSPMVLEGDYDKETKTLTLTGEVPGPDGQPMQLKNSTTFKDKNTFVFKVLAGPNDDVLVSLVYTRK